MIGLIQIAIHNYILISGTQPHWVPKESIIRRIRMKKLKNGNFAIAPKTKLFLDQTISTTYSKPSKQKRKNDESITSRRVKKAKIDKSNPNWKLKIRPDVQVLEKDPLFEGNEEMPFISTSANSHLVSRAVLNHDHAYLKKTLGDRKSICDVNKQRSVAIKTTPLGKIFTIVTF